MRNLRYSVFFLMVKCYYRQSFVYLAFPQIIFLNVNSPITIICNNGKQFFERLMKLLSWSCSDVSMFQLSCFLRAEARAHATMRASPARCDFIRPARSSGGNAQLICEVFVINICHYTGSKRQFTPNYKSIPFSGYLLTSLERRTKTSHFPLLIFSN